MDKTYITDVFDRLQLKVDRMIKQIGDKSPHATNEAGIYDHMGTDWWTSGFWPGLLWILYDVSGKEHYKEAAWDWDEQIGKWFSQDTENLHHDVGFQFLATAVIKYKITDDGDGLRRGLEAANFLAGRFNPAGNFIRAWQGNNYGLAIIDCMMNISLLFWATEVSKDPRYKHIAIRHADTTLLHFVREDGSVCHIVSFDPEAGDFIESLGGQGAGPESAWSRGTAWAIYGFANAYKYTGDIRYLNASKRIAHFFIASLPEDNVPYWDFRLESTINEPRDSSAAAIAASGLIEIAEQVPQAESELYVTKAKAIMTSLTEFYSTWEHPEHEGIITEATGHKPRNGAVNVSLIYGDYFYIEAMAKLYGWKHRVF